MNRFKVRNSIFLYIATFLCVVSQSTAQRRITPEDLASISGISFPQISPDGRWVAFEEHKVPILNKPSAINSDIWIVPADVGAAPRKMAFGPHQEYRPRWSPDGRYLAFLSDRDKSGVFQIYLLNVSGGEARRVSSVKQGIIDYNWLADGKTIAFTAKEKNSPQQEKKQRIYDDARVIGENYKKTRLYELNLDTGEIYAVSGKDENVNAFAYSHKDDRIAINVSDTPEEDNVFFHSRLIIMNRDGSERRTINAEYRTFNMGRILRTPHWSSDDKQLIYFIAAASSYLPAILSTDDYEAHLLAENYKGTIWYMEWLPAGGGIIVSSQEGVQGIIGKLDAATGKITVLKKVGTPYCDTQTFSITRDGGQIVFHAAEYNHPDDIWIMNIDGTALKRLTNMNPVTEELSFVKPEVIHWKSRNGEQIEGLLFKPLHYEKGKRYPVVVEIHGGPTWAWWNGWLASWHEWGQLLANYGFAVLMPNPRGSNGYGFEFSKANFNDWGGGDFDDVMNGLDYLISEGIADSARLGIGGWSYGGFMTAWAVTQSRRFKAAVMGAAVTDLITMHNVSGKPENFKLFFGGSPLERWEIYSMHSPVTYAARVSTPTLILHGENDDVVPLCQSYEFYQELMDSGVKTRFVVYPREGHGISEVMHRIDLMYRVIDWYTRYLKNNTKSKN